MKFNNERFRDFLKLQKNSLIMIFMSSWDLFRDMIPQICLKNILYYKLIPKKYLSNTRHLKFIF